MNKVLFILRDEESAHPSSIPSTNIQEYQEDRKKVLKFGWIFILNNIYLNLVFMNSRAQYRAQKYRNVEKIEKKVLKFGWIFILNNIYLNLVFMNSRAQCRAQIQKVEKSLKICWGNFFLERKPRILFYETNSRTRSQYWALIYHNNKRIQKKFNKKKIS